MAELPDLDISALKFLVIEGDENMREMVLTILRSFHVDVIKWAPDGEEAVKILEKFKPDIVLCEWETEKINGLELTKMIRKGETGADQQAAIIFLTAHTQIWQIMEARDGGITEYLAKPISAKTLYRRLVTVIERPRSFVEAEGFTGPDRRRKRDPYKVGMSRRDADAIPSGGDGDAVAGMVSDDEIDKMLGM